MRILYFGNGIRGQTCLKTMVNQGENVVGVVAHPGEKSTVARLAEKLGLRYFQPKKVNARSFLEEVNKLGPDLCVLSGYNQILRKEILSIPKFGVINLHGGRLPEYRGVAPINWQILNGEVKGGCSIIYVDEGIDTGDIIAQDYYDISPNDDAATATEKTLQIFPPLLVESLARIREGTVKRIRQDPNAGCYYTRRYPKDGEIDWNTMTAVQVHNLVRALVKPYPGAFTHHVTKRIVIWKTSLLTNVIKGIPGRVPLKQNLGAVVIAADRALLIEKVSIGESEKIIDARPCFDLGDDLG